MCICTKADEQMSCAYFKPIMGTPHPCMFYVEHNVGCCSIVARVNAMTVELKSYGITPGDVKFKYNSCYGSCNSKEANAEALSKIKND